MGILDHGADPLARVDIPEHCIDPRDLQVNYGFIEDDSSTKNRK